MPPGEQITLQHSFHGVFTEHLHHAAVAGEFSAIAILGEFFFTSVMGRARTIGVTKGPSGLYQLIVY